MKVIVAHPAQQHSYRLAEGLKRAGMLEGYITTVYMKPRSLTRLVAGLLPPFWKKKALGRRCDALSDDDVIQFCEIGGLGVLFCHNIPLARRWYWQIKRVVEDRFARKVAKYAAEKNADAVICYDGCSTVLFEHLKECSPNTVRIIDMSAANALYLRHIYEKDREEKPEYSESLMGWRRIWDPIDVDRTERELSASDAFLCGSEFVKRSLGFSGISSERCAVCHYGVDTSAFPYRKRPRKNENDPLLFIYLGIVSEHKGISYLLDAFSKIDSSRAKLFLVGANRLSESVVSSCAENVSFLGMVQHDEVSKILLTADVMLFPSLGDGFSLSIMEAFSSGLPVVCTENTGAADCVVEGENGFVVPVQDADELRNAIEWFLDNRDEIPRMAERSRELVLNCTWDSYYENVAKAVKGLVEGARRK